MLFSYDAPQRAEPHRYLEYLRLLATLKLDPARSQLIGGFIATYLQLNAQETKQYEREFAKLSPAEKEATMELMNPWVKQGWEEGSQEGRQEGKQVGKQELVVRLIQRRFGSVSGDVMKHLNRLSSEQLNELGEALFELKTVADLEMWLVRNEAQ